MVRRLALLCCLLGSAFAARAGSVDEEVNVAIAAGSPTVRVIVHFREEAIPLPEEERPARRARLAREMQARTARSHQRLRSTLARHRVRALELWAAHAVAVELPSAAVGEVAAQPGVERITLDALLAAPGPSTAAASTSGWNLAAIGADQMWRSGYSGQGTVVALLDTGVDATHPDLAARWRGGTNSWYDPNGEHNAPWDAHGHGTQALGLAVGGNASGTAIGVAPGALWIAAKVFNDAGQATLSAFHLAMQWALDPDANPNVDDLPDVVLAPWGLPNSVGGCNREFERDLAAFKHADVAVVFPAGNSGPGAGSVMSPANLADALATGAVDESLAVASFSARGPSACDGGLNPDLAAPGVNLRTADLSFGGRTPDAYTWVSGSSFAAAHTAGALALLRSAVPGASIAHLESALMGSARDGGAAGPDQEFGYGLIDLMNAYGSLLSAQGREPEGSLSSAGFDHRWSSPAIPAATLQPPVLIAGPPGFNGNQPGVVQLRNADSAAPQIRFKEWNYLDQWHTLEDAPLLALAPGRYHAADGSVWEVGRITLDGTALWRRFSFTTGFGGRPSLFLTLQSANGGQPASVRARRVSPSGFEAALFEEEALMDGHIAETVGYLAIHQPKATGSVTLGGAPLSYRLDRPLVNHDFSALPGNRLLKCEEEQSKDAEVWHLTETIDLLDIGTALFAQDVSAMGDNTIALRRK